jgi:anaerobic magnesium-protoporphyrin IX monomethyl ester cyclase
MMKIALIWPEGYDIKYVLPISFGYLKSNLDKKHEIKILDCSLNKIDSNSEELKKFFLEFKPDIVGVSCWSNTYLEGIKILKIAKEINPNVITVMGGAHVTCYPNEAIKHTEIDFIFIGESEIAFNQFVEEIETKKLKFSKINGLIYKNKAGKIIKNEIKFEENLDKIKLPDYDSINLEEYIKKGYRFNTLHKMNAPIWITRGCPYACKFCSASIQNGRLIRKHSVEYVINWIKHLYYNKNIRQINIIDDNFTFDVSYAKEICKAIIDLNFKNLHIGTPNGIRIERTDAELLNLMKSAGWENVIIAPESGSIKTLQNMGKNLNLDILPEKIREIKKIGLKVHGFFIIGYPGETEEDIKKTIELLRKCKLNFFFLNNFQPLPGTPAYEELVKNGEIERGLLPKNYSNGERVYTPKGLEKINFPKIVLGEYAYLAISNPLNIPYMFKLINPAMIIQKVLVNVKNMSKK